MAFLSNLTARTCSYRTDLARDTAGGNRLRRAEQQYLENALKPQGGYSDDTLQKDQIRMLLSDFFSQRDCATLVRPVVDEQQLPSLPYAALRLNGCVNGFSARPSPRCFMANW
jgi:hypothetical protein